MGRKTIYTVGASVGLSESSNKCYTQCLAFSAWLSGRHESTSSIRCARPCSSEMGWKKKTRFNACSVRVASMLGDARDCPARWLYIQFAEHHAGPAPGPKNCPGQKSHRSPLYSVAAEMGGGVNEGADFACFVVKPLLQVTPRMPPSPSHNAYQTYCAKGIQEAIHSANENEIWILTDLSRS